MSSTAALPRPPDSERGFTLLEMLVVLAIAALIAGLLYPQIETARASLRQRFAREHVAAAVEAARAAARRGGEPVSLAADRGATALVIGGSRQIIIDPSRTLRLAMQPQTITFHPDGSTTGGKLTLGTGRGAATFAISRAGGQLLAAAPAGNGG